MNKLKRALDFKNPLPWYTYAIYFGLIVFLILLLSGFFSLLIYAMKDISQLVFHDKEIHHKFISRKNFIPLFTAILTTLATLTALVGPALAVYWYTKQDKRSVIDLTYSLIKEWREDSMSHAAFTIADYFDRNDNSEDVKYRLFDFAQKPKNRKLRVSIKKVLNYLEAVAAACHEGHVDKILIRRYFETVFFLYSDRFTPYINSARNLRKHSALSPHTTAEIYSDFVILIENWKNDKDYRNE